MGQSYLSRFYRAALTNRLPRNLVHSFWNTDLNTERYKYRYKFYFASFNIQSKKALNLLDLRI